MTEKVKGSVRSQVFGDGIKVDTDSSPCIIIADRGVADALGSGSGHLGSTGLSVADRAGFAVRSDTCARVAENFLICHRIPLSPEVF